MAAGSANAACSIIGTELYCDDDLSGGVNSNSATLTTLTIENLTTNIGDHGVQFIQSGGLDVDFTATLPPYAIVIDSSQSLSARRGFHVSTDGGIAGILTGDITGALSPDISTVSSSGSSLANYHGVVGLTAETGIDFTHDGIIDVTRPRIERIGTSRSDVATGRLAVVRAETNTGDILIDNSGIINMSGGSREATTVNTTGGTAGARAIQFSNVVSELYGIYAQGNGDAAISQNGNLTLSGETTAVSTSTQDNVAESQADFSPTIGIGLPAFNTVNGVFDPDLPRFDAINVSMTGDIMVNGGDLSASATSTSTGAAQPAGSAYAEAGDLIRHEAYGVQIGSSSSANGASVDVDIDGTVVVSGGTATAMAMASSGGAGERAGAVYANARGNGANGVSISSGGTITDGRPTHLDITGDVNITGGAAFATGSGTADTQVPTGTLYNDVLDFDRNSSVSARGGTAGGAGMDMSATSTFNIDGTVRVQGGAATAHGTGRGFSVSATSGESSGIGIVLESGAPLPVMTFDTDVVMIGSDAAATGDGADIRVSAFARGGSGYGFIDGGGGSIIIDASITGSGGDASATALNGARVTGAGGANHSGIGLTPFAENVNSSLIFRGSINLTGGNASFAGALDPASDFATRFRGGSVLGMYAENVLTNTSVTQVHEGTIDITAGSGPGSLGAAVGIWSHDGSTEPGTGTVVVSGNITATGQGFEDSIFPDLAAGVFMRHGILGTLDVDGGAITINGTNTAGIHSASKVGVITLRNGAMVTDNGANGAGIAIRPFYNADFGAVTTEDLFDGATTAITIENGSTLTSTLGTGIIDVGVATVIFNGTNTYQIPNSTSVDVAGTVTGGNSTAIDLGSGADRLSLRQTAVINGSMLLGAGNDVFVFQGFTETKAVDGGADRDAIEVTVAAGSSSIFDPSVETPNLVNFETIAKEGDGTLTVPGGAFANGPLDFNVNDGTGIVSGDRPEMNVFVAGGATFRTDSQVGNAVIDAGGRVTGNGAYNNLTVNGTVAPGNSIGTLNVAGDATFNAGSTYEVEVEAPDMADLIAVTGTATINGGEVVVTKLGAETSYQGGQTYTIIEAGGGVVRNADFTYANPFLFLSSALEYGSDTVAIVLQSGVVGQDFTSVAQTFNQLQSATGLNDLDQSGDALAVYNELLFLTDADEARRAFDLASGEIHASGQHLVDRTTSFFGHLLRRRAGAGLGSGTTQTPLGYAREPSANRAGTAFETVATVGYATPDKASAWIAPLGATGTVDADGNAGSLDWWMAGLAGGYDKAIDTDSGQAWLGAGLGYTRSHGAVDARLSDMDADSYQIGIYGGIEAGAWTVSGSLFYAASDMSSERRIVFGGISRMAEADYWSHSLGLSGEAAYGMELSPGTTISPLATLDAGWSGHGGFTETGAGALNLTAASQDWGRFDTGLGVELSHATADGSATFTARAVWEHAFADIVPSQTLAFAGSPTGFTVHGPDAGRDRLRLGAGAAFQVTEHIEVRAQYDGLFSGSQSSHGASLDFKMKF